MNESTESRRNHLKIIPGGMIERRVPGTTHIVEVPADNPPSPRQLARAYREAEAIVRLCAQFGSPPTPPAAPAIQMPR